MKKIRGTKGGAIIAPSPARDAMLDAMVRDTMQRIADRTLMPDQVHADNGEAMRIKNKRSFGSYTWTELKTKK